MWDIGGQESLRQAWSTYFTGTHFLILVVDSTDRERLAVAKEELYRMLGHEVSGEGGGEGGKKDRLSPMWVNCHAIKLEHTGRACLIELRM